MYAQRGLTLIRGLKNFKRKVLVNGQTNCKNYYVIENKILEVANSVQFNLISPAIQGRSQQNFTLPPQIIQLNVIFNKISCILFLNALLCPPNIFCPPNDLEENVANQWRVEAAFHSSKAALQLEKTFFGGGSVHLNFGRNTAIPDSNHEDLFYFFGLHLNFGRNTASLTIKTFFFSSSKLWQKHSSLFFPSEIIWEANAPQKFCSDYLPAAI